CAHQTGAEIDQAKVMRELRCLEHPVHHFHINPGYFTVRRHLEGRLGCTSNDQGGIRPYAIGDHQPPDQKPTTYCHRFNLCKTPATLTGTRYTGFPDTRGTSL